MAEETCLSFYRCLSIFRIIMGSIAISQHDYCVNLENLFILELMCSIITLIFIHVNIYVRYFNILPAIWCLVEFGFHITTTCFSFTIFYFLMDSAINSVLVLYWFSALLKAKCFTPPKPVSIEGLYGQAQPQIMIPKPPSYDSLSPYYREQVQQHGQRQHNYHRPSAPLPERHLSSPDLIISIGEQGEH